MYIISYFILNIIIRFQCIQNIQYYQKPTNTKYILALRMNAETIGLIKHQKQDVPVPVTYDYPEKLHEQKETMIYEIDEVVQHFEEEKIDQIARFNIACVIKSADVRSYGSGQYGFKNLLKMEIWSSVNSIISTVYFDYPHSDALDIEPDTFAVICNVCMLQGKPKNNQPATMQIKMDHKTIILTEFSPEFKAFWHQKTSQFKEAGFKRQICMLQ